MKIVCESCGAKYSIADEKVAGKVFKIRCKRCSEVIMVRGDQDGAPEAEAGAAYEAPADAIWHVVINGEQQGPYSPPQLGELLSAETVDWDAYVWTEGFDNWAPMRDVEDLVAQITGQPQEQAAPAQTTAAGGFAAAAASEAYASQPSMGADPFAEEPATADPLTASPSSTPDLFSSAAAEAPAASNGGVVASAPSPRVSEEQAMTGARNENSVLFSLQNLQALATGSSTPSAAPAPSPGGGGAAAGFASGEGSGLIDIRALASATGVGAGGEAQGDKDELLAMGGQGAAFGALGSPMLAPSSDESEGGNKTLLIASIMGGAVVLAGGLVAFAMLSKPDAPPPAPQVVPPAAAAAVAPQANPAAPAAAEKPGAEEEPKSEGELAAEKAAAEAKAKDDDDDRGDRHRERKRSGSRSSKPKADDSPSAKSEPAPAPAPKPKARGGSSSLDDLLNAAVGSGGGKQRKAKAAPAVDANLPDKPSRNDVVKAMNGVKGAVSACGKGASGVAYANITVAGSTGRVKSAQIEGQTGAVGSCIARAVRKARFPKFKSKVFQIKYPFRL